MTDPLFPLRFPHHGIYTPFSGERIETSADEATAQARRLKHSVWFEFNGDAYTVHPETCPDAIIVAHRRGRPL